jgi:uncharacterized protein
MNRKLANLLLLSAMFCAAAAASPQDDFESGRRAYQAGDVVAAMPILKRAAEAGHAPAQSLYAFILDKAEFDEEAVKYFRLAADQGNADGEYGLGTLYAAGEGVARDVKAAREWFERAATQDHGLAVLALSQAFLSKTLGFSGDPADTRAIGWVRKAAELGSIPALDYLAKGYRSGAFGAVDVGQAERLEARRRELSPDSRRKGKGKK